MTSSVQHGTALTFETLVESELAPVRMRRQEDTLLRVIDGIVQLTVEAQERQLCAGEEAVIPAGAPHRLTCGCGTARFVAGFRTPRR